MIQALEASNCTSVLISEQSESLENPPEWYVSSGIILLQHKRKEDSMERGIQVTKMRGIRHSEKIFPIKIGENGLSILHPRLVS